LTPRTPLRLWLHLYQLKAAAFFHGLSHTPYAPVVVALMGGIALSLFLFTSAQDSIRRELDARFYAAAQSRSLAIKQEIESNLAELNSLRVLVEHSPAFGVAEFDQWAWSLKREDSSIVRVVWAQAVPSGGRVRHAHDGQPIHVHFRDNLTVQQLYPRSEQAPQHVEADSTQCSWCSQIWSQLDGMHQFAVLPSGNLRMPFQAVDGNGGRQPLIVAVPVIRSGVGNTFRLGGYLVATFDMEKLVERSLGYLEPAGLHVQVFDEEASPGQRSLYFHRSRLEPTAAPLDESQRFKERSFLSSKSIQTGGHSWLVVSSASASYFERHSTGMPVIILFACLAGSLGVAFYLHRSITQAQRNRRLLKELSVAHEQALAAGRLKTQFLANVSHELRTPMNGILGMSQMLRDTPLSAEQQVYAETLDESAQRLGRIIDEVLDFSALEAGSVELQQHSVEVRELVHRVRRTFRGAAEAKGLELVVEIDPVVPCSVLGDEPRIRQLLTHLVENAVKFSERGTVTISTTLLGRTEQRHRICFEVEDQGIGIRQEVLPRLFESFEQGDGSSTRRHGGTGIGLAISRELAALMGGTLTVESVVGKGTRVRLTLDLQADACSDGILFSVPHPVNA
jgi:signal transduction histidine kinase